MTKLLKKLNSKRGESIAEVLVALLISSLGIVLLAALIASSLRMIDSSRDTVTEYVAEENVLVMRNAASELDGTLTLTDPSGAERKLTDAPAAVLELPVVYYVNDVIAGTPVVAYRKR